MPLRMPMSSIYPSTVPIDSTRPLPFVSVLTKSVNVRNALGLICTIWLVSHGPVSKRLDVPPPIPAPDPPLPPPRTRP